MTLSPWSVPARGRLSLRLCSALLLAAAALGLSACEPPGGVSSSPCQPLEGTVERIIDGDTVELRSGQRVRYLLVDAPELGDTEAQNDCFAGEARDLNRLLLEGREVRLEYDQGQCTGLFGRLLPYVWLGDRMINEVLLERGYAFVPRDILANRPENHPEPYEQEQRFLHLEAVAQAANRGLWGACQR